MASMVVELLHSLHQAEIAFLNKVQERHTVAQVSLGYTDHQPGVGLDEMLAGLFPPLDLSHQSIPLLVVMAVSDKASPGHPSVLQLLSQVHFLFRR